VLGDPFLIVDDDGDQCFLPSVASDGTNYLVTYQTGASTTVPADQTIVAQRVGVGAFTYVDGDVSAAAAPSRGVAWGDWNVQPSERLPDLFVANATSEQNLTYQNVDGDEITQRTTGASEHLSAQAAAFGDYDNDGNLDLYVSSDAGANELYHRVINPDYFEPVGATLNVNDTGNARSVAWGDYDGDGLLDLYVGNKSTANALYRNVGVGLPFDNVAASLGAADGGNCEGVAFIDFDDDGDLDIYVGNAGSANRLLRYHEGLYSDIAGGWLVNDPGSARSVSWCDYDNDLDFDLYISKYLEANSLYRNGGVTDHFVDVGIAAGVADVGRGESACWADFDLDGDQDLFLANYTDIDRLYRNDAGVFTDIGLVAGLNDNGPSLGAAWGDMDGDGDPDLCVTGYNGSNRVYRNDFSNDHNWLQVVLEGVTANAAAIGARVWVSAGPLAQVQDVGGRNGYLSQNDLALIFGLGSQTEVDTLAVRWPGGGWDYFWHVGVNQRLHITQGSGASAVEELPPRASARLLGNWPNPFNPRTSIGFELPTAGEIELAVFDARGRRVALLAVGEWAAGKHTIVWEGTAVEGSCLPSGVYFARLRHGSRTDVMSLVFVK
jgi:hypothetical protein